MTNTKKHGMVSLMGQFFRGLLYQIRKLRHRPRLLWNKLWIRRDEFHSSLDLDARAMLNMTKADRQKHVEDVLRRRNEAHNRNSHDH